MHSCLNKEYNTWPLICNKEKIEWFRINGKFNSKISGLSMKVVDMMVDVQRSNLSLDALLETLPIVYDANLKQLKVVSSKTEQTHLKDAEENKTVYASPETEADKENSFKLHENSTHFLSQSSDLKSKKPFEMNPYNENSFLQENEFGPASLRVGDNILINGECEDIYENDSLRRVKVSCSTEFLEALENSLPSMSSENSTFYPSTSLSYDSNEYLSLEISNEKKHRAPNFFIKNIFPWRLKHEQLERIEQGKNESLPQKNLFSKWKVFKHNKELEKKALSQNSPAGSIGLIMEDRPDNLPAKSTVEQLQHDKEYKNILSTVKNKGVKEAKFRLKTQEKVNRKEEKVAYSVQLWNTEIIPYWFEMWDSKLCQDLWWLGVPSCVRGKVWKFAIGNELQLNRDIYNRLVAKCQNWFTQSSSENTQSKNYGESSCSNLNRSYMENKDSNTLCSNSTNKAEMPAVNTHCDNFDVLHSGKSSIEINRGTHAGEVGFSNHAGQLAFASKNVDQADVVSDQSKEQKSCQFEQKNSATNELEQNCFVLNQTEQIDLTLNKLKQVNLILNQTQQINRNSVPPKSKEVDVILSQETTMNLINLDVSRTFPHLCIFQKGGPFHDQLRNVLSAYVLYNPDLGYVQGMSFIAAMLLLNLEEYEAFIYFSNLVCKEPHISFFNVDQKIMQCYYFTFEIILEENLPHVYAYLKNLNVLPNMYFLDWVITLFSRSFNLDIASRLWDLYLRDGVEFIFRAGVGILKHFQKELRSEDCTAIVAQFLTRLPDDVSQEALFNEILSVSIVTPVSKRRIKDIFKQNLSEMT